MYRQLPGRSLLYSCARALSVQTSSRMQPAVQHNLCMHGPLLPGCLPLGLALYPPVARLFMFTLFSVLFTSFKA